MEPYKLKLVDLNINTGHEHVIYIREDDNLRNKLGFNVLDRILISTQSNSIICVLHTLSDKFLAENTASLSLSAWVALQVQQGDLITVSRPDYRFTLPLIRKKIEGIELEDSAYQKIIQDIYNHELSDLHIAAFLTACASNPLSEDETISLTKAMVNVGTTITWPYNIVVDKHCIGGLPGNRTTPIVVAIVAAYGLKIPKTSSRAITSPAGTADTMSVFTDVALLPEKIQNIVDKYNGCLTWGGFANLSPVDDLLIRVEKSMALNVDSQLIASILSKKIAAGTTHLLIDIPIGPEIKIKTKQKAKKLKNHFNAVAQYFGMNLQVVFTDGKEPIGFGIGPALEMEDVLSILKCEENLPKDLLQKSLHLAGYILEFSSDVQKGKGYNIAKEILYSKKAYKKFIEICKAQGKIKTIPKAKYQHKILSTQTGVVHAISNEKISILAKLSGAPLCLAAGVRIHKKVGDFVLSNEPLYTLYTVSKEALNAALNYLFESQSPYTIKKSTKCASKI